VVPLESAGENFVVNFPGSQFKAQQASRNLLIKSGILGRLWTRSLLKKHCVLTKEKLYEIGAKLEHTPLKSLKSCRGDQHLKIVNSQRDKVA
jgi:hypothetical protein